MLTATNDPVHDGRMKNIDKSLAKALIPSEDFQFMIATARVALTAYKCVWLSRHSMFPEAEAREAVAKLSNGEVVQQIEELS